MNSITVSWKNYHEIFIRFVPFCGSFWFGFDYETIKRNNITVWKCLPTR